MNLYQQLESTTLPRLKAYQTDLTTHDRRFIEENPNVPFLHYTRESGTTIIPFHKFDSYPESQIKVPYLFGFANREHILQNSVVDMARYHALPSGDPCICQYFNGKTLREITLEYAVTVAERYAARIRAQW